MDKVHYKIDKDISVIREADVVVVGSGPGGLGAAVMAARAGAKVLLVERYGCPGGMASVGEVHPFMPNHQDQVCMDRPVYMEWARRIQDYLPEDLRNEARESTEITSHLARSIGKDAAMLATEDLLMEAGVDLLYHHWLADVIMDGRKIDTAIFLSKSGYVGIRGKNFVDCTGDGDLAVKAGCEYEQGNADGDCQPMTLCFKLSHINRDAFPEDFGKWLNARYREAQERGEISCPRGDVLRFNFYDDDIMHFNTTRVQLKDATNGEELSDAEIEGRKQFREYLAFFRKHVPGFENAQIHSLAHHIGVRESRRIKGQAYLERKSFTAREKFEDGICRCNYGVDIHSPRGGDTEHEEIPKSDFYEIPYGCVVAKDVDNLTIGGRPISVDHGLHSSMRVMPPACTVGQAAGMGAAMAAARGIAPGELDGKEVRKALKDMGAYL
ncbi:MAG: FAD-dependent oxidoreductase [Candidatus Sumerlaeia bacterium]